MLARKAILNFFAAILDQFTRVAIVLFLSPLILYSLGDVIFGYWQVLLRSSNQLQPLDGRPSELLKWKIAQIQSDDEVENRKNQIGSAITIWAIFLPLLVSGAGLFFYFLPHWIGVEKELVLSIQISGWILSLNLILLGAISLLDAVFRGMNIGYKRIGLMSLCLLIGGALSAFVIVQGGGLIHLASMQVVSNGLYLALFFSVVKSNLPWIGINWQSRIVLKKYLSQSLWFMLWAFVSTGIFLGDILLLGFFCDAELVAKYAVTSFAVQSIVVIIVTAVMAVLPGIGKILEQKDFNKAQSAWREAKHYVNWLVAVIASLILLLNESFVGLWVGDLRFAGTLENILIVLCGVQLVYIRQDAAIINLALNIKEKVMLGSICLAVTVLVSIALLPQYEIVGLCIALFLGRLILVTRFPRVIQTLLRSEHSIHGLSMKNILAQIVLMALAWNIGQLLVIESWFMLILMGLFSGLILFICGFFLFVPKNIRASAFGRLRSLQNGSSV